jgi:TolB-like protein/class 3 adenylate cyclase
MSSEPVDRKLAAILSADVVGYSRLMADDEAATIRTLTSYRESIAMLIRQHRGRVVDSPGDNVLADFPTALDAVRCALEIQGVLRARNVSLATERRMEFRIGVHMGDVATEGGRVYGDGVNIAARLEGLAEAGGICISATVHDQVRNKVDVGYTDLGDQTVKNIPEQVHVYRVQPRATEGVGPQQSEPTLGERRRFPMALVVTAAVLLLVGGALWGTWPRPLALILDVTGVGRPPIDPALPDKPSVVVLPFENMSGDAEQAYFSDGLTEELTANLAGSPLLFVISRNSAFSYKGRPVRVETIGRELGVRYVVEGSVRKAGERVRITAQLIDATTGHHLWSQQYDRELSDIFAVQSEISEAILVAVGVQVNEAELARIRRRPTNNLSAYEAFTRAVFLMTKYTRKDLAETRRLLERAIEIDPSYAAAYSLLGGTYSAEYAIGWSQTGADHLSRREGDRAGAQRGVFPRRARGRSGSVGPSRGGHRVAPERDASRPEGRGERRGHDPSRRVLLEHGANRRGGKDVGAGTGGELGPGHPAPLPGRLLRRSRRAGQGSAARRGAETRRSGDDGGVRGWARRSCARLGRRSDDRPGSAPEKRRSTLRGPPRSRVWPQSPT